MRSTPAWRIDEGAYDPPHRLHLARRPAGLGEDRAKRVLRGLRPRWRMEIALGLESFVELLDKCFELAVRSCQLELFGRRLRQFAALGPFVGEQDHCLREIQRCEFGID